jgi:hypothetical protein
VDKEESIYSAAIKGYITRIIIIIITIIIGIEFSLGGSSPYTSTDKTKRNKYT